MAGIFFFLDVVVEFQKETFTLIRIHPIAPAYNQFGLDHPTRAFLEFDRVQYVPRPEESAENQIGLPFVGHTFQRPWTSLSSS